MTSSNWSPAANTPAWASPPSPQALTSPESITQPRQRATTQRSKPGSTSTSRSSQTSSTATIYAHPPLCLTGANSRSAWSMTDPLRVGDPLTFFYPSTDEYSCMGQREEHSRRKISNWKLATIRPPDETISNLQSRTNIDKGGSEDYD